MNLTELRKTLTEIKQALSITINDPTNGNELVQILSDLLAYQPLSADTVARSRSFLTKKYADILESGKYDNYSASDKKYLIQRDCGEFAELVEKAEAYNKETHYRIESIRTMISNAKELMKNNL